MVQIWSIGEFRANWATASDTRVGYTAGGAIAFLDVTDGTLLRSSIIESNSAATGGGILCEGSSPHIVGCEIARNGAGFGAGIRSEGGAPLIQDCSIVSNQGVVYSAEGAGGGIASGSGGLVVSRCIIADNYGADTGGGIFLWPESRAHIVQCLITGNDTCWCGTFGSGGGIMCHSDFATITNSTIADNSACISGDGIEISGSPTITNCVVWNRIYVRRGNPRITYTLTKHPRSGEGNIVADPRFRGGGDYRLQALECGGPGISPAIDAGHPGVEDADLSCDWGLGGSRSDMGAFGGDGAGIRCNPCIQVFGIPEMVEYGDVLNPVILATNLGTFDALVAVVTGPIDTTIPLYRGPPIDVAPGDSVVLERELRIVPSIPAGLYRCDVDATLRGEFVSRGVFETILQDD